MMRILILFFLFKCLSVSAQTILHEDSNAKSEIQDSQKLAALPKPAQDKETQATLQNILMILRQSPLSLAVQMKQ